MWTHYKKRTMNKAAGGTLIMSNTIIFSPDPSQIHITVYAISECTHTHQARSLDFMKGGYMGVRCVCMHA